MKNKTRLKTIIKITGRILLILSVFFVTYKIYKLGFDFSVVNNIPKIVGMTAVSLIFNVLSTLVLALAWGRWIVFFSSSKVNYSDAITIYGKSGIGKYLPGNVMHYVERNLFAAEYGLSQKKIAFSSVMEIAGQIVSAIVVSAFLLPMSYKRRIADVLHIDYKTVGMIVLLCFAIALIAVVLLIKKTKLRELLNGYKLSDFIFTSVSALLAGIICLLLNGGGMCALWIGLSENIPEPADIMLVLSSFSSAWVCGFVIPGAPGGIGVREAILTVLLEGVMEGPILAFLVIAHRVVCIIGDFMIYGIVCIHQLYSHK